ncbi:MAG: Lhr family helicase, partial [Gammaproteobacteria bacterium]
DQAWPNVRNADELHDFLLGVYLAPVNDSGEWAELAERLIDSGRATVLNWQTDADSESRRAYVTAERVDTLKAVLPSAVAEPPVSLPLGFQAEALSEEEVLRKIVGGWLEVLGPTTVQELSTKLGFSPRKIETAILGLEAAGAVLRGRFTGGAESRGEEWCDRVLLARIHRLTLGRLRKEIESVTPVDFMKFLFIWQRVLPRTQLRGREGVLEVIRQLQGLELPAPAWEQSVLPARVKDYDPADLENLCLAGWVTWGRLKLEPPALEEDGLSHSFKRRRRRWRVPARNAPIAFLLRDELQYFLEGTAPAWEDAGDLSEMGREVARYLDKHGASFLADIARGTGLLKVKAEEALWQLVAHGYATGDGIAGLRILLTPENKRQQRRRGLRLIAGGRAAERLMPVGRWSLWRNGAHASPASNEKIVEHTARQLLRRYGVVFRDLLARESNAISWRNLLQIYRRLEARGEIRGGRFVNGFIGEQFALPEAVETLRSVRRSQEHDKPILISSADPLNQVGILTPGARISPYSNQVIAYREGVPVDSGPLGAVLSRGQDLGIGVLE